MWQFGERYGVVRRDVGKKWWITWFRSDDVALEGRGVLFGEGAVTLDLLKGKTEQLAPDALRHLAFKGRVMQWDDEN